MKRLTTIIFSFLLVPQFALASNHQSFKALIDDHHYFMTVEWDQKNEEEVKSKVVELSEKFDELLKQGLTDQDIESVLKIPQESLLELRSIHPGDRESLLDFFERQTERTSGASWNGEVLAPVIILGLAGAGLVLFLVYAKNKNDSFRSCVAANNGNENVCIER